MTSQAVRLMTMTLHSSRVSTLCMRGGEGGRGGVALNDLPGCATDDHDVAQLQGQYTLHEGGGGGEGLVSRVIRASHEGSVSPGDLNDI